MYGIRAADSAFCPARDRVRPPTVAMYVRSYVRQERLRPYLLFVGTEASLLANEIVSTTRNQSMSKEAANH